MLTLIVLNMCIALDDRCFIFPSQISEPEQFGSGQRASDVVTPHCCSDLPAPLLLSHPAPLALSEATPSPLPLYNNRYERGHQKFGEVPLLCSRTASVPNMGRLVARMCPKVVTLSCCSACSCAKSGQFDGKEKIKGYHSRRPDVSNRQH